MVTSGELRAIATIRGVKFWPWDRAYLVAGEDVRAFISLAESSGFPVLGLDGYRTDGKSVEPMMDFIADFSAISGSLLSRVFISAKAARDVLDNWGPMPPVVEVTLDEVSGDIEKPRAPILTLLSEDADFYHNTVEPLIKMGLVTDEAYRDGEYTVVDYCGNAFNLSQLSSCDTDATDRQLTVRPGVEPPREPYKFVGRIYCRLPELLEEMLWILKCQTKEPLWIIDGDDVMWDATKIDYSLFRM